MKAKLAILLVLAALVGGNVNAGVVSTINNTATVETLNFSTSFNFTVSSSANARLNSISLASLIADRTINFTVTVKNAAGSATITSTTGSYTLNTSGSSSFSLGSLSELTANTEYQLNLVGTYVSGTTELYSGYQGTYFAKGQQTGNVFQNIYLNSSGPPEVYGPIGNWSGSAIAFSMDVTAVPEPGTMILTGAALAAGAVGAYFKRRRKAKREPAA